MNKIHELIQNKKTIILVGVAIFVLASGIFGYQKFLSNRNSGPVEEIELGFDAEGPYALLIPRRDGNAINLNINRVSGYQSFSYEMAYIAQSDNIAKPSGKKAKTDEGDVPAGAISRGVGDLNTWIDLKNKSSFQQEILLGTCSQGYTAVGPHCAFDKGVENGTLTMRFRKGNKAYRMVTQWHLQQPDIALGSLASGDNHFTYQLVNNRTELALIGFTIINDVTGVPKLPDGKEVFGKVYALNVPEAKKLMAGDVSLELAENPSTGSKLYRFDEANNSWEELETNTLGSKLSAKARGEGIFAVLTSKK